MSIEPQNRSTRSYRASRSGYVYGSAAPTYRREAEQSFDVIEGRRSRNEIVTLPSSVMGVVKVVVVVAMVVAALCCVRVGLAAASVTTSIESSKISADIESARSMGNDLEVQQSQLSNSMHIRVEAAGMNMGAPATTAVVTLAPDVVATDDAGNLSLSGSLSNIASQG